jgi:peptidase E
MKTDSPVVVNLIAGRSRAKKGDPVMTRAFADYGIDNPVIACVGAASGDNPMFFTWTKHALVASGAKKVVAVKLASKKSDVGRAKSVLEEADLVFMGGGDVEAGMNALMDRGVIDFLRGLYDAGKPFLGISAGSIMLSRAWVRWKDPDDDDSAEAFSCLGFAPLYCDTHAEDEGFAELQALLRLLPEDAIGYGIPSGAGLAVGPGDKSVAAGQAVWCFGKRAHAVIRLEDLKTNN